MHDFFWRCVVVLSAGLVVCGASVAGAGVFPGPSQFGTPTPVEGITGMVSSVTITSDGQTMVYCAYDGTWQLYSAQWSMQENKWGQTQPLNPGPGWYHMSPVLSPDGKWLFYNDSGGSESHLYVAGKQGGSWGNGQQILLPEELEGQCGEAFFDGTTLYFDRVFDWRDQPPQYVGTEIWRATYDPVNNVLGIPERVEPLAPSRPYFNSAARIVGDGNTLLFTHAESGTWSSDIWMSTRDSSTGQWVNLTNPEWSIRSDAPEMSPWYCEATRTLYFVRGEAYTLYQSTATAVPEPASLVLWSGLGIMGLITARRRRRTT